MTASLSHFVLFIFIFLTQLNFFFLSLSPFLYLILSHFLNLTFLSFSPSFSLFDTFSFQLYITRSPFSLFLFLSYCLSFDFYRISIKLRAQAVALLLSCGADPNDVSAAAFEGVPTGITPLAVALLKGHTSVAALLQ
jgi:hypothetical protein